MIEPLRELLVNPPLENSRMKIRTGAITWCARCSIHSWSGRQLCRYLATPVADFKTETRDVLPIEKPDRIIAHVDGVPC